MLTPEEKGQDVYHNLVYNMTSMADTAASLGSGSSNRFASETVADETIGAIVINNAGGSVYKLTASEVNHFTGTDENGNTVSDARLVLVIASGNVEVSTDFNGLILAGGTISFYAGASSKSIAPDPANVALALQMSHANGVKVGDYLVGSEAYIIGGLGGGASEYNAIYYLDLITYENWKKQ